MSTVVKYIIPINWATHDTERDLVDLAELITREYEPLVEAARSARAKIRYQVLPIVSGFLGETARAAYAELNKALQEVCGDD